MLFNSIDFAIFLPIVFLLYWFVTNKNLKLQNLLIVVASYVFYGWWDWRFLSLIFFSTVIDYVISIAIVNTETQIKRKTLLLISIFVNLGLLGFFKYYNFFVENFISAFHFFGFEFNAGSLNIILPVGISFYTFQTLSYTIDVYKRKFVPTTDFIAFAAFVSFFPQLVAGPIERATNLLPQFYSKRSFDYNKAVDGSRQILWGLFKKVVIADSCAEFVNMIFAQHEVYSGSTLLLGAVLFAFQIYCDFSGYSDIAIGVSRLFGFNLMQNFAFPYFSRDIAEFWRRWHISLSTWFRDYLYIPLGGSKGSTWFKIRNTFIIFIVSGFWHGANWTFIVWGALNAVYFLPLMLTNKNRKNIEIVAQDKYLPTISEIIRIIITFAMTLIAWIFFRAESLNHAISYLSKMFSNSLFAFPTFSGVGRTLPIVFLILFLLFVEWMGRDKKFALSEIELKFSKPFRWLFYFFLTFLMGMFMQTDEMPFIYFQF